MTVKTKKERRKEEIKQEIINYQQTKFYKRVACQCISLHCSYSQHALFVSDGKHWTFDFNNINSVQLRQLLSLLPTCSSQHDENIDDNIDDNVDTHMHILFKLFYPF